MEGGFLLDIIIGQGTAIFELFAGEDETLLVWWDAFLVLNFRLYIIDGVRALDFEGDGLAGSSFDEDLHTPLSAGALLVSYQA